MDYQNLEKTSMCYRCENKEICKTVYQADDLSIQQSNWNCSYFNEPECMTELKPVNPDIKGYTDSFKCDKCGEFIWTPYNYYIDYRFCPYCGKQVKDGADMRGKEG